MIEKFLIGFALFVVGAYHLSDKSVEENLYAHSPHKEDTVLINFNFEYVTINHKDSSTLFTTTKRPFKEFGHRIYPLHDYYILKSKEVISVMDKNSNKMLNYYIVYNEKR